MSNSLLKSLSYRKLTEILQVPLKLCISQGLAPLGAKLGYDIHGIERFSDCLALCVPMNSTTPYVSTKSNRFYFLFSVIEKKTLKLQNTCGFADWPVTVSWIILKHLNIVIYLIGPTFAISAQNLSAQIPLIENFTNSEQWGFVFTC